MKYTNLAGYTLLAFGTIGFAPSHALVQPAAPQRIEIVGKRFEYAPAEITVKKGSAVTLVFTSKDVDHGLKFEDLNVAMTTKKGESKEMTFTPDKAGDFVGQCYLFCGEGHGSMKMTLHVTE